MHRILPAFLMMAACDGGDDTKDGIDPDNACALEASLSDAINETLSYTDDSGCSGSGSNDSVSFSFGTNEPVTVLLWLNSGVDITQSSQSGLAATVGVLDSTFTEWQSTSDACTVDLTLIEPGEWEGDYRFVGEGGCPDALPNTTDPEDPPIDIGAFVFVGTAPM